MKRLFKQWLSNLGFYNHSRFMESSMTEDNIRAMRLISFLGIFASLLFLRVSCTDPGYGSALYRGAIYASLAINAVVFILLQKFQKIIVLSFHRFHSCMFFYILWLSFAGAVVSITDSANRGGFITFLMSQVWIYDLLLIPPFVSIIFCGINFAAFIAVISHMMYFPPAKYVETIIFYVTIVAVNYFHYRSAVIKINRQEAILNDNRRLDRLSTTDALTDVRNRTGLRLDFEHLHADRVYVMMCDIDHFKEYNDNSGHMTGDRVLTDFALALTREFGKNGVYRYGGDEFLVILPTNAEDEKDFRGRILRTGWIYNSEENVPGRKPTCSCGYVYGPCHDADTLRAMIQEADQQLYLAKKDGRNRISGTAFIQN